MEESKQVAPQAEPMAQQPSKPYQAPANSLMERVKQAMSSQSPQQDMKPKPQESSYVEKAKSGFENFLLVILVASVIAIIIAYFYPNKDESDPTSKYILFGGVLGVFVSGVLLWIM